MLNLLKKIISRVLASMAVMGLIVLPGRNIYPVENGQARIMSFNLLYKYNEERMSNACKLIAQYYPDSIGVQECTADWMKIIKELLPEYGYAGAGSEDDGHSYSVGEPSVILYRRDKYIKIDSGFFWLSDTPSEASIYEDAASRRSCSWVILQNRKTKERYVHINTHLDVKSPKARKKGLQMAIDKALSFDIPVVLTGDFNFTENYNIFNTIADNGLIYTRTAASDTMTGITYHNFAPDTISAPHIIDYICVNTLVKSVEKYKIITDTINKQFVSDHYPVMAELKL